MQRLAVVTAVNDKEVLKNNLLRSPVIATGGVRVISEPGHRNAAKALNHGIQLTNTELVVVVHQDVYLPAGWDARLLRAVDDLQHAGEPWAVLGVWGIQQNSRFAGRVWCVGGNREHVAIERGLLEVVSVDEIVIVLRKSIGLKFDEELPGFHLYATDIISQARRQGLKAYVFDGPVVHNSRWNPNVYNRSYRAAYRYMQRKWRDELPLFTCVAPVTRFGQWNIRKRWLKAEMRKALGRVSFHPRNEDPVKLAEDLGYQDRVVS